MRHDSVEGVACCACTLNLSLVWPARTRSMRGTSTPATTSTPERSIMLPSSLHAPIHRYFERLGEFLTENRDVLGESGRVKPFDVSFVHQSCDTLVVSTSLLSAHDRLPASPPTLAKTATPQSGTPAAVSPSPAAAAAASDGRRIGSLARASGSPPVFRHQLPARVKPPAQPSQSSRPPITPPSTPQFPSEEPARSSPSPIELECRKRLSWLDVLSLSLGDGTPLPPSIRALYHDTRASNTFGMSHGWPNNYDDSFEDEASHIEQGRIATTTGRALCGALVDVMLAIIRHRQRQGWSTAILIMSDDARRAVVLGLNHIGERVRANEPYVCERRLRATDRTYLPPSFSHSLPPDPAEPVGGAAIRIAYVFNRTLRDISSDCHRFNECHSAKHAPCSIAPNRCCSIRSIISTRRHRGVQPRLHCRLATVSKTRRQQLLWRAPVERNQAHSINQVQQQPLQEDSRERQTR